MHATRIRPDTRPTDLRRLAAAALSALIPGLGQLFNGRRRLALLFLVPSLVLIALGLMLIQTQSPARLVAWVVSPRVMGTLLSLNMVVLAWRFLAVGQAFLDTNRTGPTGRLGIVGIVLIAVLVALPHVAVYRYGTILGDTFERVFTGAVLGTEDDTGVGGGPIPGDGERINVLLVGVDKRAKRAATLTDTMIVASLDPVGHTVSIVSIPRDLVDTPLGNGDVYGPKLNSLLGYAERNPDEFPKGGMRALQNAVGALLDIPIHYYARLDFRGFIKMIDTVGGVDVTVKNGFEDPSYDGGLGYAITAGTHHLDGAEALAFARSRKGLGESDFTRQARQQQILIALRDRATRGGSLVFALPDLLDAVGETIRSDVPVDELPTLAAIMDEIGRDGVTSVVIRAPLIRARKTRYGDSQVADLGRIRAVAAALFSVPGTSPQPWPTPQPTTAPKSTATPKATPGS